MMDSRRRVGAWVALAAAAVAAAALALLAVRNAVALAAVAGSLVLLAAAAWGVVRRRGAARVVAAAGVVAAVGIGIAAVLAIDVRGDLALLAAALLVLALTAPWVLRPAASAAPAPPQAGHHRASGRAVLLMNPKSGGGKVVRFDLEHEAARRGIATILLGPDDDLRELAEDAARGADVIGMAGGDGSQALVADVAAAAGIEFVCIPAGTRNHFALDLGIDRDDVVGALDAYGSPTCRRVDLARVNGRVFVNNVSLGIYAQVVQSEEYRDAKLATAGSMLPDLVGPHAAPFDLRFTGPDGEARSSAHLILVSNNPYVLDNLLGAGKRPRLDTGRLGIVALEIADGAAAGELVGLDMIGRIRSFPGWHEWSDTAFVVGSGSPVAAGVDGEAMLLEPPLRFALEPSALRVRVGPTVVETVGGAHRLGSLWEVAIGRR